VPRVVRPCTFVAQVANDRRISDHLGSALVIAGILRSVAFSGTLALLFGVLSWLVTDFAVRTILRKFSTHHAWASELAFVHDATF
jgi:hypothetical protein